MDDSGWLTILIALVSAAASWGAARTKIAVQGRLIEKLEESIQRLGARVGGLEAEDLAESRVKKALDDERSRPYTVGDALPRR